MVMQEPPMFEVLVVDGAIRVKFVRPLSQMEVGRLLGMSHTAVDMSEKRALRKIMEAVVNDDGIDLTRKQCEAGLEWYDYQLAQQNKRDLNRADLYRRSGGRRARAKRKMQPDASGTGVAVAVRAGDVGRDAVEVEERTGHAGGRCDGVRDSA